MRSRVVFPILILLAAVTTTPAGAADGDLATSKSDLTSPKKVIKTEREWAKQLTQAQFYVTRRKSTEPAFSGKYLRNHALGMYVCVCCDQPLFNSRAKFESGTGWPSFWTPVSPDRIQTAPDFHGTEPRIEVTCSRCDAHLGHVFDDGPPPTGLRFCMNSVALKFVPETKAKASAKATAKPSRSPKPDPAPAPEPDPSTPSSSSPSPSSSPTP